MRRAALVFTVVASACTHKSHPPEIHADRAPEKKPPSPVVTPPPSVKGIPPGLNVPITLTWIRASTGPALVPTGIPGFEPQAAYSHYEVVETKHLDVTLEECVTVKTPMGTLLKVQPSFVYNAYTVDPVTKLYTMSITCISFHEPFGASFRFTHSLCQHLTTSIGSPTMLLAVSWDTSKIPTLSLPEDEALQLMSAHDPEKHSCR